MVASVDILDTWNAKKTAECTECILIFFFQFNSKPNNQATCIFWIHSHSLQKDHKVYWQFCCVVATM